MKSLVRPIYLFAAIIAVLAAFSVSIAKSTTGARERSALFKADRPSSQAGNLSGIRPGVTSAEDLSGADGDDFWLGWLDHRYPDSRRGGGIFPSPRLSPATIDSIWPGNDNTRSQGFGSQ